MELGYSSEELDGLPSVNRHKKSRNDCKPKERFSLRQCVKASNNDANVAEKPIKRRPGARKQDLLYGELIVVPSRKLILTG